MAPLQDIESAKLRMLEARKALEDYETHKGYVSSGEHSKLILVFNKTTKTYLRLSADQR